LVDEQGDDDAERFAAANPTALRAALPPDRDGMQQRIERASDA
jgi:hypothetical protein